jgi:glycosyltransferase involved in cell wall biosynthesis
MTSGRKSGAKDAVLVLGMHRSGTSSVAGTLVKLGVTPPKSLMAANSDNPRGHWESLALVALNDEILKSAGSAWDDWRTFNASWYTSPIAEEFHQKAADELNKEFGNAKLIVIKDPRMCRMVPFWSKVFNGSRYTMRFIIPVRSPLEVSRSLWIRDKFPINKGLLMWLRHVLDAEMATFELPRSVIDWGTFIVDWRLVMARAGEQIGLSWPSWSDKTAAEIDQFLSANLRHYISDPAELAVHPNVNEWVQESYRALLALTTDPLSNSARLTLHDIRVEFDKASKMFGEAIAEFEQNTTRSNLEIETANRERDFLSAENKNFQQAARDEQDRLTAELAGHVARINALAAEREAFQLERAAAVEDAVERMKAAEARSNLDQVRAAELEQEVAARMQHEQELEAAFATASQRARELEQEVAARMQHEQELEIAFASEIASMQSTISALHASTSWRATAPLRSARRLLTRLHYSSVGYFLAQLWRAVRSRSRAPLRDWRDARIVSGSAYFDGTWYLANNRDVAEAGFAPASHYASRGWREGRNPGPAFDTRDYLAHNRDVERGGLNPLVHYVRRGAREARAGGVVRPAAKNAPPEIAAFAAERFASDPRPVILMLLHQLGGGTETHVRGLATMLGSQAIFLVVKPGAGGNFALSTLNLEEGPQVEFQSDDWNRVCAVLHAFNVRRVHVHHTFGFLDNVQGMLHQLGVPYDLTIHDYMLVCPRMFLYRDGVGYCGEPDVAGCLQCLREEPPALSEDILWWRWLGRELIEGAERVICPSQDVAARIERYVLRANLVVVPHEDPKLFTDRRVRIPPLSSRDRMRVAVLGGMTAHKGAHYLLECIAAWKASNLRIDVTLIGESFLAGVEDVLHVTGRYEGAQLPNLIADLDPHLVFYPQKSPETYSYTLSEGLRAGVPLLVPDLGAFRERTERMDWCWLYDPTDSPAALTKLLRRIRVEHLERNTPPLVIRGLLGTPKRETNWEFYQSEYLAASRSTTRTISESIAS